MTSAHRPPGMGGLPLFGYTNAFLSDPLTLLQSAYNDFGPVFYLQVFGRPNIFMAEPDAAKFMLQDHPEWFSSREGNLDVAQQLFGVSVLFMDGDDHKALRNFMSPAFHSSMLKSYVDIMIDVINEELRSWIVLGEIDVYEQTQRIALEIVVRTLLGISMENDYDTIQPRVDLLARGLYADVPNDMPWTRFGKGRRSRDWLRKNFRNLVDLRMSEAPKKSAQDLLDRFTTMRIGNAPLSFEDIVDQINTFLFAGYDTSSSTMAWVIWYLVANPHVEEKLISEISHFVLDDSQITYELVHKMKYLDCVVNEVNRLMPPVYFLPRMAMQNVEFKEFLIPKGWLINAVPLLTHRLPHIYSQPNEFDPDRFLPPREEHKRFALAYFPFGAGPKACIGSQFAQIEIKLFLILVYRQYRMKLKSPQMPAVEWLPSAHPKSGLIVNLS